MTQKDKELLLKDLCARLPYGVKLGFYASAIKQTILCTLLGLEPQEDEPIIAKTENGSFYMLAGNVKPYLFPLSSITPEQEKELSKLGVSYGEYAIHDDIRGLGIMVDEAYIFFEFCYKNHIDFLGLIDMGLANDATGLNIY